MRSSESLPHPQTRQCSPQRIATSNRLNLIRFSCRYRQRTRKPIIAAPRGTTCNRMKRRVFSQFSANTQNCQRLASLTLSTFHRIVFQHFKPGHAKRGFALHFPLGAGVRWWRHAEARRNNHRVFLFHPVVQELTIWAIMTDSGIQVVVENVLYKQLPKHTLHRHDMTARHDVVAVGPRGNDQEGSHEV